MNLRPTLLLLTVHCLVAAVTFAVLPGCAKVSMPKVSIPKVSMPKLPGLGGKNEPEDATTTPICWCKLLSTRPACSAGVATREPSARYQ